jgi:hypothetical protein
LHNYQQDNHSNQLGSHSFQLNSSHPRKNQLGLWQFEHQVVGVGVPVVLVYLKWQADLEKTTISY